MTDKIKGKYSFNVDKHNLSINFIDSTGENLEIYDDSWSHYAILEKTLDVMKSRGFLVGRDIMAKENYKSLSNNNRYGRKGDLQFKTERYPNGFRIEFYQDINFKNKNGGYYDFDKFDKVPYLIKLMFINETNKIAKLLESLEILNTTKPDCKLAEDSIKQKFVKDWHHPQENMDFNLSDLDGTTNIYSYNNTDRDSKTILNGQIKYFRDERDGRLKRGKVYHNINNMWWVIVNKNQYRNIACFNLFDATSEDYKIIRKVRDKKPEEYLKKIESLKKLSDQDLIKELKRRRISV